MCTLFKYHIMEGRKGYYLLLRRLGMKRLILGLILGVLLTMGCKRCMRYCREHFREGAEEEQS